jgi:multicomponent Na+:H+ antiporter subunit E
MKILKRIYYSIDFLLFYVAKLVVANLQIAWDILTPKMHDTPGFIECPLDVRTDPGILLVSNLISMTPGTLSIDIPPDRSKIRVHVIYMDREKVTRAEIARMQEKIKRITE